MCVCMGFPVLMNEAIHPTVCQPSFTKLSQTERKRGLRFPLTERRKEESGRKEARVVEEFQSPEGALTVM